MATSITTLPASLSVANKQVSDSKADAVATVTWRDDAGAAVSIVGTREILFNWVRRIRGVVVNEQNSFDATNVGPQT